MRIIMAGGLLIAAMLTCVLPRTGGAAVVVDVKAEIRAAMYYSGELARKGPAQRPPYIGQTVIDCLEGPLGRDYDRFSPPWGNPCEAKGRGIIPDLEDQVAAKAPGAKEALNQATLARIIAVRGMAKVNVDDADYANEVKGWAALVERHLKAALLALGS